MSTRRTKTMGEPLDDVLKIAELVMMLGKVNRVTEHPDGTRESDTTHTVMLALVAAHMLDHSPERSKMDLGRVMVFAIVHDLVEAIAGDVDTSSELTPQARAKKDRDEADALTSIRIDLPWIAGWIDGYERQDSPEAQFVHYLDKVMPRLTNTLNWCAPVRKRGTSKEELITKQRNQGARLQGLHPEFTAARDLFTASSLRSESVYPDQAPLQLQLELRVVGCPKCGAGRLAGPNEEVEPGVLRWSVCLKCQGATTDVCDCPIPVESNDGLTCSYCKGSRPCPSI